MLDLELLQDSPHLLGLLIQMEDVLDRLDIYVFPNWIKGEIVDGPRVRRYWLSMTLRYPYRQMPDPRAALRLLKHGIRVDFRKVRQGYESLEEDASEPEAKGQEDETENLFWLITISIPRILITQLNGEELDYYENEVDVDDAQEAKDTGLNDMSPYSREDQQDALAGGGDMPPNDEMMPPEDMNAPR